MCKSCFEEYCYVITISDIYSVIYSCMLVTRSIFKVISFS